MLRVKYICANDLKELETKINEAITKDMVVESITYDFVRCNAFIEYHDLFDVYEYEE